jgi:glycosyltransferase involved in cell wall biosynthesis
MPPARTGVADYSIELLRALEPLGPIAVACSSADILLYHLGNNLLHLEIYKRALEKPGVVVLHDAVLQHFFLGALDQRSYIAEFVYNYGAWNEDLARHLWKNRARSAADPEYFRYPMLKRVVERSLGVIVHNPRAAAIVAEHVPGARVYEVPHLFQTPADPPAASDVVELREQLGIAPGVFLFGVFGHLRESKRLTSVLRAFDSARRSSAMALLIAGEFASTDLARSIQPLLNQEAGVLRAGYMTEREFWRHASAADACINLRYPTAGETSGITIRFMGLGKPVLVSGGLEVSRFPEDACLRIDPGPAEEEMLAEYMVWLAQFMEDARAVGERGKAYIREFHAPARIAQLYWQALTDCYYRT